MAPEFPFTNGEVEVLDSYMRYVEVGNPEGKPIVLLHGQPTSSFLWRNVIAQLPAEARIIAPDAIGYGASGRPDIDYSWQTHIDYMTAFIDELELEDVTLVVHDFGSFQGLAYAATHPDNVRGLVMAESIVAPIPSADLLPPIDFTTKLLAMRSDPEYAHQLVVEDNYFIESLLSDMIVHDLSPQVHDVYRAAFPTAQSREKLLAIPLGIPIAGQPADNHEIVANYFGYLQTSDVPKLLLSANPGALLSPQAVAQFAQIFPNTTTVDIGEALHFVQEDQPGRIADAITTFYRAL